MWKKLRDIDFSPSRPNRLATFFQTKSCSIQDVCYDCLFQNYQNQQEYLQDKDEEIVQDANEHLDRAYFEKQNVEQVSLYCCNCEELIQSQYMPSTCQELVVWLMKNEGFDLESAYGFAINYFEIDDLTEMQNSILPQSLIEELNTEFGSWELMEIEDGWASIDADEDSYEYNLNDYTPENEKY